MTNFRALTDAALKEQLEIHARDFNRALNRGDVAEAHRVHSNAIAVMRELLERIDGPARSQSR